MLQENITPVMCTTSNLTDAEKNVLLELSYATFPLKKILEHWLISLVHIWVRNKIHLLVADFKHRQNPLRHIPE